MTEIDGADLTREIKEYARSVGFDVVGVAAATPFEEETRVIHERIAAGHYDGLPWFSPERATFSGDPRNLLPTARSIISLAMSYRPEGEESPAAALDAGPRGRVSSYAWGSDYHTILKERMERVAAFIRARCGPELQARTLVDTARIIDRAAARRAGVGWVGKHTNVITKDAGSWVFLGEILTELDLAPDAPLRTNCGSCDLCLRACPTGAIVAPYTVDSDRCISYLTIEHRGVIPRDLRAAMGDWVFGCDICQEVCPPNQRPGAPAHDEFRGGATLGDDDEVGRPALIPLLEIDDETFRRRFGKSPIKRAKRVGLQRNAAVALGNSGDRSSVPALAQALREGDPVVKPHAAWALGRLGGPDARAALVDALDSADETLREEIEAALAMANEGH